MTRLPSSPDRRRRALLLALAGSPLLAACGGDPLAAPGASAPAGSAGADGPGTITVGSANFAESEIIGELYAQVLEAAGVAVERRMQIGAREVYLNALQDGSIDLIAEYTGNLLGYLDADAAVQSPQEVNAALEQALPEGLALLTPAAAEDKDSYNVTAAFAREHGLRSLADLADVPGTLRIGGLPELAQREYGAGLAGLTEVYGVPPEKMEFTAISDGGGPLTVRALTGGDVDVANIFSTTPAIQENGLVTLEDPKAMITPQHVVPVIVEAKATDPVRTALGKVQAQLTTEDLRALNARNAGAEKAQPREVAAAWLQEKGLV